MMRHNNSSYSECELDVEKIINFIAVAIFIAIVVISKNNTFKRQIINLFSNDLFKFLYLSSILFIDVNKYPYVAVMLVLLFFFVILILDEDENMENVSFVDKNILN